MFIKCAPQCVPVCVSLCVHIRECVVVSVVYFASVDIFTFQFTNPCIFGLQIRYK